MAIPTNQIFAAKHARSKVFFKCLKLYKYFFFYSLEETEWSESGQ